MNHYDDLQRFKDKTRNQQYDFKDFSAQNTASDQGNWALINQLSPASDDSKLAMGGHVSLPQPQPVDPALFANIESEFANIESESENIPATVSAAPETAATVTPVAPILRDVAHQLAAASVQPVAPVVHSAPKPRVSAPVTPTQPSVTSSEPANFARLFASKPADVKPTVEKNQSLQSLLERIASCR